MAARAPAPAGGSSTATDTQAAATAPVPPVTATRLNVSPRTRSPRTFLRRLWRRAKLSILACFRGPDEALMHAVGGAQFALQFKVRTGMSDTAVTLLAGGLKDTGSYPSLISPRYFNEELRPLYPDAYPLPLEPDQRQYLYHLYPEPILIQVGFRDAPVTAIGQVFVKFRDVVRGRRFIEAIVYIAEHELPGAEVILGEGIFENYPDLQPDYRYGAAAAFRPPPPQVSQQLTAAQHARQAQRESDAALRRSMLTADPRAQTGGCGGGVLQQNYTQQQYTQQTKSSR